MLQKQLNWFPVYEEYLKRSSVEKLWQFVAILYWPLVQLASTVFMERIYLVKIYFDIKIIQVILFKPQLVVSCKIRLVCQNMSPWLNITYTEGRRWVHNEQYVYISSHYTKTPMNLLHGYWIYGYLKISNEIRHIKEI